MINPQEIRLKNWVNKRYGGEYSEYAMRGVDILCLEDPQSNSGDTYMPIPITAEILEKCGFKKDIYGWHKLNGFGFFFYDTGIKGTYFGITIPSQSLHQLQNIYYALTGEELIYTP